MADQMMNHGEPEHHDDVHHEETDINVRAVLVGAAITAAFFVATVFGLRGMYVGFRALDRSLDPQVQTRIEEPASVSPGVPEFATHWSEPARYLEAIREEDREILEEYGWVDRSAGVVHVPIEVGMKMALEKGYPSRGLEDSTVLSGGEESAETPIDVMRSEGGAERDAEGRDPL